MAKFKVYMTFSDGTKFDPVVTSPSLQEAKTAMERHWAYRGVRVTKVERLA